MINGVGSSTVVGGVGASENQDAAVFRLDGLREGQLFRQSRPSPPSKVSQGEKVSVVIVRQINFCK